MAEAAQLRRRYSWLANPSALLERASALKASYSQYLSSVSTDEMAISLELAAVLDLCCDATHPQRILDLGSGYSSFLFRSRTTRGEPTPYILSVDDSSVWLDKTRRFLAEQGLPTDELCTWDELTHRNVPPFDLILHDLGSIELRTTTLRRVLSLGGPECLFFLDDVHVPSYHLYARALLRETGHAGGSLRRFTRDRFGRYSLLVYPRRSAASGPS